MDLTSSLKSHRIMMWYDNICIWTIFHQLIIKYTVCALKISKLISPCVSSWKMFSGHFCGEVIELNRVRKAKKNGIQHGLQRASGCTVWVWKARNGSVTSRQHCTIEGKGLAKHIVSYCVHSARSHSQVVRSRRFFTRLSSRAFPDPNHVFLCAKT